MDITTENQRYLTRENSLSTKCSCSECDSLLCFTKRRFPTCLCSECKKSKTCIFKDHENNDMATNVDQINEAYLNTSKYAKSPEMDPTIATRSGINFDLARKRAIEANKPKPKSLDEYLSILLPETTTSKVNHKTKPESLAQYIDIIKGNIPSHDKESSLDIYIKKFKEANHEKPSENVSLHNKERVFKPMAQNTTCKGTCKKCRQRKYTQIQNVMLTTPIININPRIAKLSSEIMDLSYKGSSVSSISKISEVSKDDTQTSKYDFFNYDIFKKIKDVYKACSCKVCECIPTKMLKSEVCNCKPCDCIECTRYINTLDTKRISKPLYHLKCTCNKYKKDNKKSFAPKAKDCSCKPCNCAQCQNKDFQKSCNCKPCQCIDCKKIVPLYQVYRGEVHQNSPCQCLPCKCTECLRGHGASSKNAVHEVSTTTSRQSQCQCEICPNDTCKDSLDTCKCDNRNIFKKPFDRVRHDYDIRTATIMNDIYHHGDDVNELQEQNAETIFACSQKYQLPSSAKVCTCKECECINFEPQENAITAIKSSRLFSCESNLSTNNNTRKSYNCKPCECYKNKEGKLYHIKHHKPLLTRLFNRNDCNCIGDSAINQIAYEHDHTSSVCNHGFENINNHDNILGSWPIKKGDVLTPSAHQSKIQNQMMADKLSTSIASNTRSLNKIVCTDLSTSRKSLNNHSKLRESYPIFQSQTLKEDLSILSDSNISEFSSSGATSEISFCNRNNEITTISEQEYNYRHDNNYDLCHNHPSYIIRFPRSTVETCLNDVFKFDFSNDIKLTDFNILSKRNDSVSENNKSKKSVASFTDVQEINNKNHSMMERNTAQIYYHDLVPSSIENHNYFKNTHIRENLFKTNPCNNYKSDRKQDKNYHELRNLYKSQLANRYNCYSCYNLSNIISNNDNTNKDSYAEVKNSQRTYFDNIVEDLNIKEDHERVHETLKDAKKFYLHLLQLLETYEKANREFQSISAKLKIPHMNMIGEKVTNKDENIEIDNLDEHLNEIPTRLPVVSNVKTLSYNNRIFAKVNDIAIASLNPAMANLQGAISSQAQTFVCDTLSERLEDDKQNKKLKSTKVTLHRKHISCTEAVDNQLNEKLSNVNVYSNNLQNSEKVKDKSNKELNQKVESSKISSTKLNGNKNIVFMIPIQFQGSMCIPTNKNSFIEKSGNENDNLMNNFRKEIKERPFCSTYNDKCIIALKATEENKAIKLHSLPNSLINNPKLVIESLKKPECDESLHEKKFLNSVDQKVKFELVRKVSAHSILVKWKPPLDLRNVRGYKMLVDGQAVQKIFSPHNCIAVVTCLPQFDKIEITILTITYSPTKNSPTATIVYQPHYNKNGFKN